MLGALDIFSTNRPKQIGLAGILHNQDKKPSAPISLQLKMVFIDRFNTPVRMTIILRAAAKVSFQHLAKRENGAYMSP